MREISLKKKALLFLLIYFLLLLCFSLVIFKITNVLVLSVINFSLIMSIFSFYFLSQFNVFKIVLKRIKGRLWKFKFASCGKNLQIGKNVMFGNSSYIEFGDNCDIADNVVFAPLQKYGDINYSSKISVGNNVHFGTNDRIASKDGVIIEDDVLFAAFVHVTDHSHEYRKIDLPISRQGVFGKGKVVIKKGSWLAFGCHVLSGVTIGEHSVVAANSVVTKDVPPYSVVAGNPAKIISQYNFQSQKWERKEEDN